MVVAVGLSGTRWLSALTLSFDSSECLPHPCRVTSSFLPNCPSPMDNSNNYMRVYIYICSYALCVSAFAKWRVSKEWQSQTWIILWGRTWRQRKQQISRCLWQKAPAQLFLTSSEILPPGELKSHQVLRSGSKQGLKQCRLNRGPEVTKHLPHPEPPKTPCII